jgi:hypothetical protein
MKKMFIIFPLALVLILAATNESCKKKDSTAATPTELIADDNTFSGFMAWSNISTKHGIDPSLGTAHAGNDSTGTRVVFLKNNQDRINGKFPVGTLLVKHSYTTSGGVNMYTAMVKRGNNFNPSNNDWEWMILSADGKIMKDSTGMQMRGASLMGGMCGSCHSHASGDFVYSK